MSELRRDAVERLARSPKTLQLYIACGIFDWEAAEPHDRWIQTLDGLPLNQTLNLTDRKTESEPLLLISTETSPMKEQLYG